MWREVNRVFGRTEKETRTKEEFSVENAVKENEEEIERGKLDGVNSISKVAWLPDRFVMFIGSLHCDYLVTLVAVSHQQSLGNRAHRDSLARRPDQTRLPPRQCGTSIDFQILISHFTIILPVPIFPPRFWQMTSVERWSRKQKVSGRSLLDLLNSDWYTHCLVTRQLDFLKRH